MKDFVSIPTESFSLNSNELKNVSVTFFVPSDTSSGIYNGKIIVKIPESQKELSLLVNVRPSKQVYDLKIEIQPESKVVGTNDNVQYVLNMFNIRGAPLADINLRTIILNLETNETHFLKEETFAIGTQVNLLRTIVLPSSISYGHYALIVETKYDATVIASSDTFEVSVRETIGEISYITIIAIVLGSFVGFGAISFVISHLEHRKHETSAAIVFGTIRVLKKKSIWKKIKKLFKKRKKKEEVDIREYLGDNV